MRQADICEGIADGLLVCFSQHGSSGLRAFASKITPSNESLLLNEDNISKLRNSPQGSLLSKYLVALLTTALLRSDECHDMDDSQFSKKMRKLADDFFAKVFLKSIVEMNAGNIINDGFVYQFLFKHIDYLTVEAACSIAEHLIQNFSPVNVIEINNNGKRSVLDFLCPLCNRGGETVRKHILEVLKSMDWREHPMLMTNSFIECCVDENDCRAAIRKIEETVNSCLQNLPHWPECGLSSNVHTEVQYLPQLLHRLTSLGSKLQICLPTDAASQILDILSMTIDCLFTFYFRDHLGCSERSKIQHVCYMIFDIMAMTFPKDQALCQQVLHILRHRCLHSTYMYYFKFVQNASGYRDTSSITLSVGKLVLIFLGGRSSRETTKISSELFCLISEIHDANNHVNSSLWCQPVDLKELSGHITCSSLKNAFELLFAGPLMFQGIASPIIHIAFTLIDACKLSTTSTWEKITSSIVYDKSKRVFPVNQDVVEDFGKWILIKLFSEDDSGDFRKKIIGGIILRMASASSASISQPLKRKDRKYENTIASHCVDVLQNSIQNCCTRRMLELSIELQEVFLYATKLSPDIARKLMNIFYTLLANFPGLSDRYSIVLRKACFSRDNENRLAAASSILALLRCHLRTSAAKALSNSQSSAGIHLSKSFRICMKDIVLPGFSVEEIMVLIARFLRYQCAVQSLVYEEICEICVEIPEFRPVALRMLRTHLLELFVKNDDTSDCDRSYPERDPFPLASSYMRLDVDKCIDEYGRPLENCKELINVILYLIQMECPSDKISVDLFSLFGEGNVNESLSFSQNEIHIQNREGHFCCELLWSYVNSMMAVTIETICPVVPHSQYDLGKLEVSFTAYYSAMIVTMTLPVTSISEEKRYNIFQCLFQKARICIDVANMFLKNQKEMSSKLDKSGKPQPSHIVDDHDVQSTENIQNSFLSCDRKFGNSLSIDCEQGSDKFTMLLELKFISKLFNLISLSDIKQPEAESPPDIKTTEIFTSEFLGGLLLERATICLEKAVVHFQKQSLQKEFSSSIIGIVGSFYPSLLRYMMFVRKGNITDDDRRNSPLIFLSLPTLNSASLLQLLFRGLLGCVKILLSSSRGQENINMAVFNILHTLDVENLNSTSVDGGTTFTDVMKIDDETARKNRVTCVRVIEEVILYFVELLVALQSKQSKVADKLETSVLVALIGEFFELIVVVRDVSKDPRSVITEKVIEKCGKFIDRPSLSLTSALVSFLVVQAPTHPVDRLNKSFLLSSWMKDCIFSIENQVTRWMNENGNEIDESDYPNINCETFFIFSSETLCCAVSTLIAILDKALIEVYALLRAYNLRNNHVATIKNKDKDCKATLYPVMKKFAEILSPLFSTSIGSASLEKVLTFTTRFFKLLITLIKDSILWGEKTILSIPLKEMVATVSQLLSPNIHGYLNNSEQNECEFKIIPFLTRGRRREISLMTMASKLDKIIPELIFQMEQFDVNLIKLSNYVHADKSFLAKLVKRSNVRDFRLKLAGAKDD